MDTPDKHFSGHRAAEAIHTEAPDYRHAPATDMAQRIEELFEDCDRYNAGHALTLDLLRLLRPGSYNHRG